MKVNVKLENSKEAPLEFELNIQDEILPQVEQLCSLLKVPEEERHKYTLKYDKKVLSDLVCYLKVINVYFTIFSLFPFVF